MSRITKILLPLAGAAIAATVGGYFYAPVRLFAIAAAGRSPVCPLENALKADENLKLQIRYKDEILGASRLIEKDPAGFHLWDTPRGRWWIPEGDDWVLPFNLAEQQRQIYGTGERAVKAGDTVLDCGANVGVYTRVALDAGAKTVVAIEPAPENLEALRRNFSSEIAAGRVIIMPKGVWDKDDMLTLSIDPHNTAADSFVMNQKPTNKTIQVPLVTIDELVAELKLERVDYIKMDIEGAETHALAGAQQTLAKFHPRLSLASYHVPTDPERIPQLVRQAWPGYQMECGPCAEANGRVRPDVLYFY
ncbi:MAG TPA: FkbM family methyltransferase [Bryobacteraceae bacterium]|nr:FkbM family methyltransferase [Bryobacteraceae bacterium]